MTSTVFSNGTVIQPAWLNDVDAVTYGLPDPTSAADGANLVAYTPSLAYTLGLGAFLNYTFGRSANEIAAGVTPTNCAYIPGHVKRYGAVIDGSTDDTTALATWLSVGGILEGVPGTAIVSSQLSITLSGTRINGKGMVLKCKAAANYEKTLWATGLSDVRISDLTVDVNQANRVASLTTRAVGIYLDTMTDSAIITCTVKNAVGYTAIPGFGMAMAGASVRCQIINPNVQDCGIAGKEADGIFMSGTQITCDNPTVKGCLDTGIAIESSQQCGVTGGTIRQCGAICAITNAVNATANGNYIDGLTGYDWNSTVTGGIQIGNPLSTSTGNLLNTRLSNITLERNSGSGPAINVRKTGTAITHGLVLDNVTVKGASTQCLLMNAEDVVISESCVFEGTANSAAIQLSSGSARITIRATIRGQFTFGIYSDSVSDVNVQQAIITGDGVNSTHGVYFANTASNCRVQFPVITGITTARVGSDAGTTPMVVQFDPSSTTPKLLFTKSDIQVLTTRQTGWGAGTNPSRVALNGSTATLAQTSAAVAALMIDLSAQGVIGT